MSDSLTYEPTKKKCICTSCGKEGFCLYQSEAMAYCPTFIRKRLDVKKPLATSSAFKVLSRFQIRSR